MEYVRTGKLARVVSLAPDVSEKLARIDERVPFGVVMGPEGEHALAWALSIAVLAGNFDLADSDKDRALRILAAEVERREAADERTRSARRLDPALRAEVFAAFDAGRSRHEVQREHQRRCDERRAPWASEDAIRDLYRAWKRRPVLTLRAGKVSRTGRGESQ
jgi:hypothetical protein